MEMGSDIRERPRIVDVSLPVPPETTGSGFMILARFTLLIRPLRVRGCALVRAPDGKHLIWTPDEQVKITAVGQAQLVEIAFQAMRDAARRIIGESEAPL